MRRVDWRVAGRAKREEGRCVARDSAREGARWRTEPALEEGRTEEALDDGRMADALDGGRLDALEDGRTRGLDDGCPERIDALDCGRRGGFMADAKY